MSNSEERTVIELSGVSKYFDLPTEKNNSLKQLIVHPSRLFSRKFTRQVALENINFEVKDGEFFGIVGKNGSGKSTLLKILAGIYKEDAGTVHVDGSIMPFIELGVGFNTELTGRENVFLSGALLGFSEDEMAQRYDDIVAFAELEEFMDQKLKNYSSGMQVRLAFAIATQVDTDIFLIDEVLAVGDTEFQRKCYDYFKQLKKSKKTVVFITHDMSAVRQYCDRAMLIDNSEIQYIGSVDKITKHYDMLNQRKSLSKQDEASGRDRWGDEKATVTKIKPHKVIFGDDDPIRITTSFKVDHDIDNAVIGIGIFDKQERPITGTNTDMMDAPLGSLKKGESHTVVWEFDQVLNDGEYDVSVEIKHDGGISDSWAEAARFAVTRSEDTGFLICPPYRIEIDGKEFVKHKDMPSSLEESIQVLPVQAPQAPFKEVDVEPEKTVKPAHVPRQEPGVKNALEQLYRSSVIFIEKQQMKLRKRAYVFGPVKAQIPHGNGFEEDLLVAKKYDFKQMELKPRIRPHWYLVYISAVATLWVFKMSFKVLRKIVRAVR